MAQLFVRRGADPSGEAFTTAPGADAAPSVTGAPGGSRWLRIPLVLGEMELPGGDGSARLVGLATEPGRPGWILVQPADGGATKNGVRVGSGAAVVRHGDCLRAGPGATPHWFSSESRPVIAAYSGPADAGCARCRQPLQAGRPAVRCPRCHVWHHEDDGEGGGGRCWTYAARCARCEQATPLGGRLRWLPGMPLDG